MNPYNNTRWRKARATYLLHNPICVDHEKRGMLVKSVIVDHIIPHKGNMDLFWDQTNWQALCKQCHDSWKQRQEKSGITVGGDVNGMPLDMNHPWSK